MIPLIISLLVTCVVIYILIFHYLKKIASLSSVLLKNLDCLNKQYYFFDVFNRIEFDERYDNENVFLDITCDDVVIYHLDKSKKYIKDQIEKAKKNKSEYKRYLLEFNQLKGYGEYLKPVPKLLKNAIDKMVLYLAKEKKLLPPTRNIMIEVKLELYRMNGNYVTEKSSLYYESQIIEFIKEIEDKSGSFYNNRNIWNSICRVERGKVTNALRFRIYERDNYRCQICGKSYKRLEIDHIIPISKGGKSTIDNLQTLCHECNYNKSNRL